ncbi:MAG: AAA family ATPase [Gemmatimonadaceae bacterium]
MHSRRLESILAASRKSVLLLGPRQVGKSTLMRALQPTLEINLAHEATFLEFARNPLELESRIAAIPATARRGALRTIFIDEISKGLRAS